MAWQARPRGLLGGVVLLATAGACRVLVESPDYVCVQNDYLERFDLDDPEQVDGFEELEARCWRRSGAPDPDDLKPDDGDLVIRVSEGQRWAEGSQGPFAYQRVTKDFVLATRVEVLNQATSSHCLGAKDGAGLAVRDDRGSWATMLLYVAQPPYPPDLDCASEVETLVPPTNAFIETNQPAWGSGFDTTAVGRIGSDGEADIAICRLSGVLYFFYRNGEGQWVDVGGELDIGEGGLDAGLAASGDPVEYLAEGHFAWAWYWVEVGNDGCAGALAKLKPEEE